MVSRVPKPKLEWFWRCGGGGWETFGGLWGGGWEGSQIENRYSHWIWRQYASSVWDDIRGNTGTKAEGVLRFKQARDPEDEKHLHPLQLDVISRALELYSNPGETLMTPCAGVGSEVYASVRAGRRAIGIELKPSYWRQSIKNLETVEADTDDSDQMTIEDMLKVEPTTDTEDAPQ